MHALATAEGRALRELGGSHSRGHVLTQEEPDSLQGALLAHHGGVPVHGTPQRNTVKHHLAHERQLTARAHHLSVCAYNRTVLPAQWQNQPVASGLEHDGVSQMVSLGALYQIFDS